MKDFWVLIKGGEAGDDLTFCSFACYYMHEGAVQERTSYVIEVKRLKKEMSLSNPEGRKGKGHNGLSTLGEQ